MYSWGRAANGRLGRGSSAATVAASSTAAHSDRVYPQGQSSTDHATTTPSTSASAAFYHEDDMTYGEPELVQFPWILLPTETNEPNEEDALNETFNSYFRGGIIP